MTYLITGGLGFIGSNFVKHLIENEPKSKIIVLDALTYSGNLENLNSYIFSNTLICPKVSSELKCVEYDVETGKLNGEIEDLSKKAKQLKNKLQNFNPYIPDTQKVSSQIKSMFEESTSKKLKKSRLAVIIGNITDKKLVNDVISQCDVVVNFAAETHVDRSIMNPDEFIKTDVYGTFTLLEAARNCESIKKFVHVSTDEVYGVATEKSFNESDPINPRNPYSASKAAADRLVYSYNQTYNLPVNIVRPTNNFGPYQYPEKLIPVMIIKALTDEFLPVYGDGRQIRDWLYVEDTVRAIKLVIEKGQNGEVYNIAGNEERENIEIVNRILDRLKKPKSLIKHVEDRPGHDRRYSIDDSKLRNELGFSISGSFKDKLNKTIDWYIDNRDWWDKIVNDDKEYRDFMKKWYKNR